MATDHLSRVLADIDSLLPPGAPSNPQMDGVGTEPWEWGAMRWQPVGQDQHPDAPAPPEPGDDDYEYPMTLTFSAADVGPADDGMDDPGRHFPTLIPPQYRRHQPDPDHDGDLVEHFHPQRTPPRTPGLWPAIWLAPGRAAVWSVVEAEYDAAMAAVTNLAQHTATYLQHHQDRRNHAQAVINARRNRNTGPTDPRGIDGRARRHQHPRKAAARNASPATQGSATPEIPTGWWDLAGRFHAQPTPPGALILARISDGSVVVAFDPAVP